MVPIFSVRIAKSRSMQLLTAQPIKRRYTQRNRIGIMFFRLKDWQHGATRYDRCPKVLLSASSPQKPSCSDYETRTSPLTLT